MATMSTAMFEKLMNEIRGDNQKALANAYNAQSNQKLPGVTVAAQAAGAAAPSHMHQFAQAVQVTPVNQRWSEQNLYDMLSSRMGWNVAHTFPFKRLVSYKVTDDKVVIFIVTKNDALMLEDDAFLYPSDALVTQVRLLAEAS